MNDQLDLFHQPTDPAPDPEPVDAEPVRPSSQLTELPGTTWEDIFRKDEAA